MLSIQRGFPIERIAKALATVLALAHLLAGAGTPPAATAPQERPAGCALTPQAPLFRDPVFDGAADPALIWNDKERAWWIFYTNRRANAPDAQDGVRWCHGTDIGIASSADGGRTWTYRGTAKGLEFEAGRNTFWAPCLLEHGRVYHLFAAYVRGVPADWSGERHIAHYTSRDLVNWKFEAFVPLSSENVIDAFVAAKRDGGWRMWYKDEAHGSYIYAADSEDLFRWSVRGPVVTSAPQEGPAVFWWKGSYWLLVDRWQGMAVLSSPDLESWTEQPGKILGIPGTRPDDGDLGRHGEVLIQGDRAFLFYFTHPYGAKDHVQPGKHRSSLQAAELEIRDGLVVCDRNKPVALSLKPPSGYRPVARPPSSLELETSDRNLADAFDWAKAQALDYVFPASVHGDPVGDWYEAALPSRFAFCMRDVSHQAAGAAALGLARFNRNMLRRFAAAVSASRDYCSYWEIDKFDRPAPVDYKNDKDFWYNLPANFDVLDACWRQYLWTGDRTYIEDPIFLDFYRISTGDYVRAWDRDGDGIPEHRPEYGNRGLGSYDEGPFSEETMMGADLVAAMRRAFLSYADILSVKGEEMMAERWATAAGKLAADFLRDWWRPDLGRFGTHLLRGRKLNTEKTFWGGVFLLYFGIIPPGPERDKTLEDLLAGRPENIEIESYLPEVYYRYGADGAACAEILALCDPRKERREYPEVPFAVIGAVSSGLFGIQPDGRDGTVLTRPRLSPRTEWAELRGVPVLGNQIAVRHSGRNGSTFENTAGPALTWIAVFPGRWPAISVDGVSRPAETGKDENGLDISWARLAVKPGERRTAKAG